MHWFWDLVNLSTKPPLQLPHWSHLLKQPFSQKYQNLFSESSCLAPGHLSESVESFSEQVTERIKAPQIPSSGKLYNKSGPFLNSGSNRIRWSDQRPLSQK